MTNKPAPQPSSEKSSLVATRRLRFDAARLRPTPRPFFLRWLYPGKR